MARILLIQPPVEDFYATAVRTYPLGLLYVAAAPLSAGHTVSVLDCVAKGGKKNLPLPHKFRHLAEYYRSGDQTPYRLFSHFSHFGLDWPDIETEIRKFQPDWVGISSLFTPYHSLALKTAEIAKRVFPDVPVVMGGGHVSVCGAGSLYVDHVVKGEGDDAILKLIGEEVAPGNGRFPARSLINADQYRLGRKKMAFLLTSRGCPHACAFCSVHGVFKGHRVRPVADVLAEMKECAGAYGITHFDIEDDSFGYDKDTAFGILSGVAEWNRPDISLSAMNGLCADVLDEVMLTALWKAGFRELNLSLVSASQDMCRRLKRPFDPDLFARRVKTAKAMGFSITAYVILGLPGDTLQGMMESILFLNGLGVRIGPSLFYPVPGTPLYRECLEKGLLTLPEDYDCYRMTAAPVETAEFKRSDLMTLFRICRLLNAPSDHPDVSEALKTGKMVHRFKDGRTFAVKGNEALTEEIAGRVSSSF